MNGEPTAPGLQELTAAATAYEGLHVPALFAEWPEHVLDAAGVAPGDHVLDVACGTGVLTRSIPERVGEGGSISGIDLNPGMLAVAARLNPEIEWHGGAAESLPFTLAEPLIQEILSEAETVLAPFVEPNGDVVFDSPAHIIRGRVPA